MGRRFRRQHEIKIIELLMIRNNCADAYIARCRILGENCVRVHRYGRAVLAGHHHGEVLGATLLAYRSLDVIQANFIEDGNAGDGLFSTFRSVGPLIR